MARVEPVEEKVTRTTVTGYTLRLTVQEAEVLADLCRRVAGVHGPLHQPTGRNVTNSLGEALAEAGVQARGPWFTGSVLGTRPEKGGDQ